MVNGYQHAITWHVDDVKSSHVDKKVNDDSLHWLKAMYDSDGIGELKVTRGLRHNYLAMMLDYTVPGTLKLDMTTYVAKMVEDFLQRYQELRNAHGIRIYLKTLKAPKS
jgi:hypothetical protein